MNQFTTIEQVWQAIDKGLTVYWSNTAYKVYIEPNPKSSPYYNSINRQYSTRNEQLLSIRCISNYFGSIIHESELSQLFTSEVNHAS